VGGVAGAHLAIIPAVKGVCWTTGHTHPTFTHCDLAAGGFVANAEVVSAVGGGLRAFQALRTAQPQVLARDALIVEAAFPRLTRMLGVTAHAFERLGVAILALGGTALALHATMGINGARHALSALAIERAGTALAVADANTILTHRCGHGATSARSGVDEAQFLNYLRRLLHLQLDGKIRKLGQLHQVGSRFVRWFAVARSVPGLVRGQAAGIRNRGLVEPVHVVPGEWDIVTAEANHIYGNNFAGIGRAGTTTTMGQTKRKGNQQRIFPSSSDHLCLLDSPDYTQRFKTIARYLDVPLEPRSRAP